MERSCFSSGAGVIGLRNFITRHNHPSCPIRFVSMASHQFLNHVHCTYGFVKVGTIWNRKLTRNSRFTQWELATGGVAELDCDEVTYEMDRQNKGIYHFNKKSSELSRLYGDE